MTYSIMANNKLKDKKILYNFRKEEERKMEKKKYLTTKEAVELLGVSSNYIQRGLLKPIKLSPVKMLFNIDDIIKTLNLRLKKA